MKIINACELLNQYTYYPDDAYLPISRIREDIKNCHEITALHINLKDDFALKKFIFDNDDSNESAPITEVKFNGNEK